MMWSRTCFTSSYRRPWGDMCEAVVVGTGLMLALPSLKVSSSCQAGLHDRPHTGLPTVVPHLGSRQCRA